MATYVAVIRGAYPPHETLLVLSVQDIKYALTFLRPSTGSFSISRADPNFPDAADLLRSGAFVTFERTDGLYPWAGFVMKRDSSLSNPLVSFELKDHAGALYAEAFAAQSWRSQRTDAATHIETIFAEADERASPPLLSQRDLAEGGVAIEFAPAANKLLDILSTLSDASGWEWALQYDVSDGQAITTLKWTERIGADLRSHVILEEGRHFKEANYTQDASGMVAGALVIGGSGPVADRPFGAAQSRPGVPSPLPPTHEKPPISPIGDKIGVDIKPDLTNEEALTQAAVTMLSKPRIAEETLSMTLVESELDMNYPLHPGALARVRFSEIDLGLGMEREIRVIGLQLTAGSGEIEVEVQVL